MLRTRLPLTLQFPKASVRLACVKHAASVHPEPGSNSPLYFNESFESRFFDSERIFPTTLQLLRSSPLQIFPGAFDSGREYITIPFRCQVRILENKTADRCLVGGGNETEPLRLSI